VKTSAFVATSLDGFIAREDGSVDWLPQPDEEGEDYGYAEFMGTVDAMVMGRRTFEAVLAFEDWPYGAKPVVVLSHAAVSIPEALSWTVEAMSCAPAEVMRRLGRRGLMHLYVDGGRTIQGFLADGLLNQLIVTTVPVLLGRGVPLFGPLDHDVRLRLMDTRQFNDGLVQHRYEMRYGAADDRPPTWRPQAT